MAKCREEEKHEAGSRVGKRRLNDIEGQQIMFIWQRAEGRASELCCKPPRMGSWSDQAKVGY